MNATAEPPAIAAAIPLAEASVIDRVEQAMLGMPQVEIEPVHSFSDGVYARQITIPAGTLLTGRVHKHRHLCIIASGDIAVFDEQHGVKRVQGPLTFESQPGARRMGYAHTDTVFITIHATRTRNLEQLEAELFEPSSIADELLRRKAERLETKGETKPCLPS